MNKSHLVDTKFVYVFATRRSRLALIQTDMACKHLKPYFEGQQFQVLPMSTTGDRQLSWSLEHEGGKGLFTKEIEDALLNGTADLAIHSAKDLPTEMNPRLVIAGYLPRAAPNDVMICEKANPKRISTGSPRRRGQAKTLFPNAEWSEIRGNVETRLSKIRADLTDATFLAQAGLERLGYEIKNEPLMKVLPINEMVPAVGQGAIAIQCRKEDKALFAPHLDDETLHAVSIERSLLAKLSGGCQSAFAAHFADGILYFFHESTGLKEVPFLHRDPGAVDAALDRIIVDYDLTMI